MAPRSLVEMALKVACDNIHLITSLANMPPQFIHVILKGIKSAHQLHQIEENTEGLYLETSDHWRRIIQKDFPKMWEEHKWVAEDPKNWYRVWCKYKKINDDKTTAATEALRQKYDAEKKERDSHRSKILHISQASRLPSFNKVPSRNSHWSQNRPKTTTPLSKVRSQVKAEASRLKLTPRSLTVVPTKIERAPESMIQDKRIERQFDPTAAAVRAPRAAIPAGRTWPTLTTVMARTGGVTREEKERRQREARLLQIKNGGAGESKETPLAFSDEEEEAVGRSATTSPAKEAKTNVAPAAPIARRRPLLSATPGANKATRVSAASPPKSTSVGTSASPPALKPTTRRGSVPAADAGALGPAVTPTIAALSAAVTGACASAVGPPQPTQPKRKREVDIFMRPKKKIRH